MSSGRWIIPGLIDAPRASDRSQAGVLAGPSRGISPGASPPCAMCTVRSKRVLALRDELDRGAVRRPADVQPPGAMIDGSPHHLSRRHRRATRPRERGRRWTAWSTRAWISIKVYTRVDRTPARCRCWTRPAPSTSGSPAHLGLVDAVTAARAGIGLDRAPERRPGGRAWPTPRRSTRRTTAASSPAGPPSSGAGSDSIRREARRGGDGAGRAAA